MEPSRNPENKQVPAERLTIELNPGEARRFLAALDDPATFEAGLGALTQQPSGLSNEGLVDWLLACPQKGYFAATDSESTDTLGVSRPAPSRG